MKIKTLTRALCANLFLAVALSMAPNAVQATPEAQDNILKTSISNFDMVSPDILRGGVPSDIALEQLAKHGIKTVVDLRMDGKGCEHEHVLAHRLGLQYVHIPMGFKKPKTEQIVAFLNTLNNKANLPVFVHCHQGADRTGTLLGIYRVVENNWTFRQTYKEMRLHHFKPFLSGMKNAVAFFAADKNAIKVLPGLIDFSKEGQDLPTLATAVKANP
jgi:tyrosine-protein phosphatase SIW14